MERLDTLTAVLAGETTEHKNAYKRDKNKKKKYMYIKVAERVLNDIWFRCPSAWLAARTKVLLWR